MTQPLTSFDQTLVMHPPSPLAEPKGTFSHKGRGPPALLHLENKLIPASKTSLTLRLTAAREGPEAHRNFSGAAGGAVRKVPETGRSAES